MNEVHYCSECKYAKIVEFEYGLRLICTRRKVENVKQAVYAQNFAFYMRYTKVACSNFEQ